MSTAEQPLYLTIDQGGHASRALVFDRRGMPVAQATREIGVRRYGRERVEYEPAALLGSVREAVADALGQLGPQREAVRAAGLATQRSNVVCWDLATGEALSPVISWQDRRAAGWLARLRDEAGRIRRITGLPLSPHYGANKLRWCCRNLAAVRAAQRRGRLALGPMASYLLFHLLKERPFVVDPVHAARTLLWDLEAGDWSDTLLGLFGLPRGALPAPRPCRHAFGSLAIAGTDIPLVVVTGDQSAALYAHGPPSADRLFVTAGTGAFVQRVTGAERPPDGRLLTGLVFDDGRRPSFAVEGTVNGAGSALDWLAGRRPGGGAIADIGRWLDEVTEPPLFLNGVSGLGTPFLRAKAPLRFIGRGDAAARAVAVVESIIFLLQANIEAMGRARDIHLGGGLARLDGLCQRLADLSGLAVSRCRADETTAQGLAFLLGARPGEGRHDRFDPRHNDGLARRHARWREALERALDQGTASRRETTPAPGLVAHRGYAGRYPENTLPAVEAALRAGVRHVEVDLQLTADGVPVLLHDATLDRTAGRPGRITELTSAALGDARAGERDRLGSRFADTPVPRLADLVRLLADWPEARVFLELKQESLDAFGQDAVVGAVMGALAPPVERFIPISFNAEAVRLARRRGAPAIGWVLHRYGEEERRLAEALRPDFLFCNYRKLPPGGALWRGGWRWVLYEVTDPATALLLAGRGADLVETMTLDAYAGPPWSLRIA
jgi:glycerol kinase